jgi:hypothetical protein
VGEIARWNGHKFEVTPSVIRSFTGLNIKGSSKTEDKESGGQGYVSRKQGQPKEISLTAHLSAQLGCDVQTEAMSFVNQATSGSKDYFYIGSKKLLTCSLMLTEASVSEIGITNGGKWVKADVKLTFKQCSKNDGSTGGSSGGGGGSNKTSVKKKSTTTTKKTTTTNVLQKVADGIKTAVTTVVNKVKDTVTKVKNALTGKTTTQSPLAKAVSTAVTKIKSVVSAAKAVTTQKKTTTTKSTGGGGGGKRVNMVK